MSLTLSSMRPEPDEPLARQTRRRPRRQRAAGLAAAILVEALVVLALLTFGTGRIVEMAGDERPLSTFDIAAPQPDVATPAEPERAAEADIAEPRPQPPDAPAPVSPPAPPAPTAIEQPTPLVTLSPGELAASDLRRIPSAPARPPVRSGPPAPSGGGADTPLVDGSGPNGEKLYAAAWQREPSDGELRGYLSTAQPGWATIACRTVEEYRVEDCVAVAEYPRGSQLARAVLAAAWQFRVRPPRIGGRLQVGEWVRIRIDYGIRRRNAWEQDRG